MLVLLKSIGPKTDVFETLIDFLPDGIPIPCATGTRILSQNNPGFPLPFDPNIHGQRISGTGQGNLTEVEQHRTR